MVPFFTKIEPRFYVLEICLSAEFRDGPHRVTSIQGRKMARASKHCFYEVQRIPAHLSFFLCFWQGHYLRAFFNLSNQWPVGSRQSSKL